ncbi:MAG TPA: urate oxidase [Candidatus Limnocylindrales bacterium]|nr:urate oxidase [Candidatus Limnocylindrales bacterium]
MAIRLGENNYGKSRVRLLRVVKQEGRHDIREVTLGIAFEGDFDAAHTKGDNRKILPTDTMKNTVYVLARQYPIEAVEDFCAHLVEHFLTYNSQVTRVRVEALENPWSRIPMGGKPHTSAFLRAGPETRTAKLAGTRDGTTVHAGIQDLVVLKTTKSAFEDFLRDPYTTLKEDRGRILSTSIHAEWLYDGEEVEYSPVWHGVRQTLLETFAEHDSKSLQHTLYAMGEAVLGSFDRIREIRLSLPNKHFLPVDLSPFGMDNPAEVFLPTDEPHGLIEATVRKE